MESRAHPDEVTLLALAHGELAPPAAADVRRHVDECDECGPRLARVSREDEAIGRALGLLDHPAPRVTAEAIAELAGRRQWGWGGDRYWGWERWAAAVVVVASAAGVAYAIPGSPVRAWVDALLGARTAAPAPAAPAPVRDSSGVAGPSGIEVLPGARLVIELSPAQDGGALLVRLTDDARVAARSPAGAAAFTMERDRLLIAMSRGADVELDIPRGAPSMEVRIGAEPVFAVVAGSVTRGPAPAADGVYRIGLLRGRPSPPR